MNNVDLVHYRMLKGKVFNPLTPRSDEHVSSPYNTHILSSIQVERILQFIM